MGFNSGFKGLSVKTALNVRENVISNSWSLFSQKDGESVCVGLQDEAQKRLETRR